MVNFELGKEIGKDVFSSCHERGTKEKLLNHEKKVLTHVKIFNCSSTCLWGQRAEYLQNRLARYQRSSVSVL